MKTQIKSKEIVRLCIILLIGIILGAIFFRGANEQPGEEAKTMAEKNVYTCAMHPQIRQDKPGLCPICAMELTVPNTFGGEGASHADAIHMTSSAAELSNIKTTKIKRGVANKEIYLLGKVEVDERNIAEITARFEGRIEQLFVNYTGQKVKKGQRLGTIYSPELITAQKEFIEALKFKETNPSFHRAAREKLKYWNVTNEQIDAIEQKGEPKLFFDILAPLSGTVSMRHVAVGDYVQEGQALFEVVDLSRVWVMFDVYEQDLPWMRMGSKIDFSLPSVPGKKYSGKISYIDPFIDPMTRVSKVRINLNNYQGIFKPEMFVNGMVQSKETSNKKDLLLPKSAVLWTGKSAVVYVKITDEQGMSFEYREVTLGAEIENYYVVKHGLYEGEEVAVNGVFKIDASAQLAGKQSMMNRVSGASMNDMDHSMFQSSTFTVAGNCSMCKKTIEKSVKGLDGIEFVNWNKDTKILNVSYNKDRIDLGQVHEAIASVGYDTDKKEANKEAYEDLPLCCQYRK